MQTMAEIASEVRPRLFNSPAAALGAGGWFVDIIGNVLPRLLP